MSQKPAINVNHFPSIIIPSRVSSWGGKLVTPVCVCGAVYTTLLEENSVLEYSILGKNTDIEGTTREGHQRSGIFIYNIDSLHEHLYFGVISSDLTNSNQSLMYIHFPYIKVI